MKIGFTGSHGVGKTTACYELVTELKKRGYDAELITEAARSCPFPINEQTTTSSQLWIFAEMLKREIECKADIKVCDRTLLDVLAYTKRINEHVTDELRYFVEGWIYTYDIIFYMKPNPNYLKKDNIRSTNESFQKQIKDILDLEIKNLDVDVVYQDTSEERLQTVLEKLRERSL